MTVGSEHWTATPLRHDPDERDVHVKLTMDRALENLRCHRVSLYPNVLRFYAGHFTPCRTTRA